MRRKLLVEIDVETNIDGMSELRQLFREGLDDMFLSDVKDKRIRTIEIVDIHGIDLREDTK